MKWLWTPGTSSRIAAPCGFSLSVGPNLHFPALFFGSGDVRCDGAFLLCEWMEKQRWFSSVRALSHSSSVSINRAPARPPPPDSAQPNNLQAIGIRTRLKTWSWNKECANKICSSFSFFSLFLSPSFLLLSEAPCPGFIHQRQTAGRLPRSGWEGDQGCWKHVQRWLPGSGQDVQVHRLQGRICNRKWILSPQRKSERLHCECSRILKVFVFNSHFGSLEFKWYVAVTRRITSGNYCNMLNVSNLPWRFGYFIFYSIFLWNTTEKM